MKRIDLTPEQYKQLAKGNLLAKAWARKVLGRRRLGRFLRVLQCPACAASIGVTREQVEQILAIPAQDRQTILSNQVLVNEFCSVFEPLTVKLANRYARIVGKEHHEADVSQLRSEAKFGLLKAIYSYSKTEVKFITYAYVAIKNELSRYVQRHVGFTLSGNSCSGLLVRYKRELERLTVSHEFPPSLEDVCLSLKLKPRQIQRIKDALRSEAVAQESDMEESLAKLLINKHRNTHVDGELIERMERVLLTRFEKEAFMSLPEVRDLFPDSLPSLKDVAERHGHTPQAASEAAKRARKKLAAALGDYRP